MPGCYYAFPALLPDLLIVTGWSEAQLAAGPTAVVSGHGDADAVTGRLVDRGLGGEMLIWLPALAAICVALLGYAPNLAIWIALWARDRRGAGGVALRDLLCLSDPTSGGARAWRSPG